MVIIKFIIMTAALSRGAKGETAGVQVKKEHKQSYNSQWSSIFFILYSNFWYVICKTNKTKHVQRN